MDKKQYTNTLHCGRRPYTIHLEKYAKRHLARYPLPMLEKSNERRLSIEMNPLMHACILYGCILAPIYNFVNSIY